MKIIISSVAKLREQVSKDDKQFKSKQFNEGPKSSYGFV